MNFSAKTFLLLYRTSRYLSRLNGRLCPKGKLSLVTLLVFHRWIFITTTHNFKVSIFPQPKPFSAYNPRICMNASGISFCQRSLKLTHHVITTIATTIATDTATASNRRCLLGLPIKWNSTKVTSPCRLSPFLILQLS